jgi:hypothetical protein
MAKLWQRRPLRLGGLMVGGLLLAFALTSCIAFSVTVNSVTGAYEPYNPMYATGGIPAEDVAFTVNGSPTAASLTCLVEVFNNSGQMVGNTVAGLGEPPGGWGSSQEESIGVSVTGDIFNGTSSNAFVKCGQK